MIRFELVILRLRGLRSSSISATSAGAESLVSELALLFLLVFTACWRLYVLILSARFKRLAILVHFIAKFSVLLTWLTSVWRAFENLLTKRPPPCCRCPVWASTRAHRLLCGLGTSICEKVCCRFMPTCFTVSSTTLSIWDTD